MAVHEATVVMFISQRELGSHHPGVNINNLLLEMQNGRLSLLRDRVLSYAIAVLSHRSEIISIMK